LFLSKEALASVFLLSKKQGMFFLDILVVLFSFQGAKSSLLFFATTFISYHAVCIMSTII
ncbi:hypothetical protein, partial [Ornithinibacillus xuwenensis]